MKKSPLMPPETFAAGMRRLFPLYPVLSVFLGLAYFFALRTVFDYSIGHFAPSLPFALIVIFTIAGLLASAVPAYLAKHTVSPSDVPADNALTLFGSVLTSLLAILLTLDCIKSMTPDLTVFAKLNVYALPFLAVSMLLSLIPLKTPWLRRIVSIAAVLSVNLHLFACYFDPAVPIDSPVRNLTIIMQGSAILYLLAEARLAFGADSYRITIPFYIFASGTTVILSGGIALGGLSNRILFDHADDPNLSLLWLGLFLALAVHAAGRLISLPAICSKYKEPPKPDNSPEESQKEDK